MNPHSENAEKVIDLSYLERLSNGDKVFIKEMITLFLSENPEELNCLEKEINDKNFDGIKTIAHKLRSTIPFLGLDKLIEKDVTEIENLATKKTDLLEIEKRFMRIKSICVQAYFELKPA